MKTEFLKSPIFINFRFCRLKGVRLVKNMFVLIPSKICQRPILDHYQTIMLRVVSLLIQLHILYYQSSWSRSIKNMEPTNMNQGRVNRLSGFTDFFRLKAFQQELNVFCLKTDRHISVWPQIPWKSNAFLIFGLSQVRMWIKKRQNFFFHLIL